MDKYSILQQYFGYPSFRGGQEALIDSLLAGRDALGIMPTGAGKSLCFQVPALLLPGVTLVVSPLISLMKDQVEALLQAGVPAAYINSSLTRRQSQTALELAAEGKYKIIYVAPERLESEDFLSFAQRAVISLVSVDEAHCVSQWGQDFRPSYLKIPEFLDALPARPPVGAFTATATELVRKDIVKILRLDSPEEVVTGFDRPNLYFGVQRPQDKYLAALSLVKKYEGKSGILYCSTRKNVEQVCDWLNRDGVSASRYHAGLSDLERRENQDAFLYDRARVMVATNAFGMGIDKSNVSFVIHYNMPKNLESYYQEAGRAGRDGEPADCVLLYSGQDVVTARYLIENGRNEEVDEETAARVLRQDLARLSAMAGYCSATGCLRQYILRYFGEPSSGECGNCSGCLGDFQEVDCTVDAQKILSCVKRMGERYGAKLVTDVLRGSKGERPLQFSQLSTYGIMRETSQNTIRDEISFLAENGYLQLEGDEYPILKLGKRSSQVLFQGQRLMRRVRREELSTGKASPSSRERGEENPRLLERLKSVRAKLARIQGVPAYIIFSDASLHDMCALLPKNEAEFLEVSGVGQVKLERYGEKFLQEIHGFLEEQKGLAVSAASPE